MIFKQFYLPCLAHASYIIGDEQTGTAAVVDPQRDTDQYIAFAAEHALKIKHVFLTHLHADFVAGHLELRDRVGATIYLGAAAKAEYAFTPLRDGDIRRIRTRAPESPGNAGPHSGVDLHPRLRSERQRHATACRAHRRHFVHRRRRASRSARGARLVGQRTWRHALRFAAHRSCWRCRTKVWCIRLTAQARSAARRSARKRYQRWESSAARTTRCSP